eukprot:CAMPEP_0201583064 /NCGR_PEP_ID=MMETSP0190_2-20130828/93858_1 /ASSEMBLY_ACC=CAM_ASM_000263 /TAXON_ID=37353 /ORGANISM="Rosalina sp." /LENGTH=158 /DNA_ID=CAMNT_0048024241 /DNA_START=15 /DNA_END=491 /DNA_ORIENTATION=+
MPSDEHIKLIIRGAVATWKGDGKSIYSGDIAKYIQTKLKEILGTYYNIIVYPSGYNSEKGYPLTYVKIDDNYFYYKESASSNPPSDKIMSWLKREFKWATVHNIESFQHSIQDKANIEWSEYAYVHVTVRKAGNRTYFSWCGFGKYWKHDGYDVWVYS